MITIYNSLTDISTATAQGKITAMFGAFTAQLMHCTCDNKYRVYFINLCQIRPESVVVVFQSIYDRCKLSAPEDWYMYSYFTSV